MADIWDDAAAKGTATATPPPQQQSDQGDVWDQAAARPIPQPLDLGNKNTDQTPPNLADPSQAGAAISNIPAGFAKSAGQTVNTISKVLNKIPGVGETLAPSQGISTAEDLEKLPDPDTAEGVGQNLGAGAEQIGEFVLGDEAIKGLTLAQKYSAISAIHKALETSPKLSKAVDLGMQAMRQGTQIGAQQMLHGASPSEALQAAGIATVLGVPVGQIAYWGPETMDAIKAAQANKYFKTPADMLIRAVNPPEEVALSGAQADGAAKEYAKFDKELKSNLPYLIGTAQEQGKTPMGRRDLVDLAVDTSDKFNSLYQRDILQPVKDVTVLAKASIPNYQGAMDMNGTATLQQLDDRLDKINDMLYSSYERGKGGLPSEAAIGQASELTSEARGIRKLLYSELQNRVGDRLGVNVAEVRTRNGQLRDIADTMERRWQQARGKAAQPLGDSARSLYQRVEQSVVRAKRNVLGDPRDSDIRAGWKMLQERGDHGLPVSIQGPSVPPPTNAYAERTPGYRVNIPERGTDIVWEGSTPEEIAAQKAKIENRANTVKNAREQANLKVQQNKAAHGPNRGVPDATGEP